MKIDVVEAPPGGVEADVLAFAVRDPVELSAAAQGLDRLVEGRLTRLVEDSHSPLGRLALALQAHDVATPSQPFRDDEEFETATDDDPPPVWIETEGCIEWDPLSFGAHGR